MAVTPPWLMVRLKKSILIIIAIGTSPMIVVTVVARAVLAFLIIRHFDSLLLFPEAFGMLVMQKAYSVAKSAVVPELAKNDDNLVNLNRRLALM